MTSHRLGNQMEKSQLMKALLSGTLLETGKAKLSYIYAGLHIMDTQDHPFLWFILD